MFGLRVASSLDVKRMQGGNITDAMGVTDQAAWARHRPGATPPGESIRSRYRVFLHIGDTASADLPGAFRTFAKPPRLEVQAP